MNEEIFSKFSKKNWFAANIIMGNPIFESNMKTSSASSFASQSYAEVAGRIARRRNEYMSLPSNQLSLSNDHPVRYLILEDEKQTASIPHSHNDIGENLVRQMRPLSLIFGQDQQDRRSSLMIDFNTDHQTMETVMERLRRQLRNSSARVAQEAHLAHRERREINPREQLEQMRRGRLRTDNDTFHSANYHWNISGSLRDPLDVEDEDSFPDHVFSRDTLDRRIAALIRPRE